MRFGIGLQKAGAGRSRLGRSEIWVAVVALAIWTSGCGPSVVGQRCGAGTAKSSLYGLPGQPAVGRGEARLCAPSVCETARRIPKGLVGVNDGPARYALTSTEQSTTAEQMGHVYVDQLGVKSVRPDEAGRAFDIRCMFPVNDLENIPDPSNDANWNWEASDRYFDAIIDAGLAPLLKLGVMTWTSTRLSGLAFVDETNSPRYVIPPQPYADCAPWPAISPVIEAVGPELVVKIVDRYNDPTRFGVQGRPALDADTWVTSGGFAGVELMNEWSTLVCGPLKKPPQEVCAPGGGGVDPLAWAEACAGEPFAWSSRYWDGTPKQAYAFYTETAQAIRKAHPKVRVGGPATATGPSTWPCGAGEGAARDWVVGFLEAVRATSAPMDFFSWHYYDPGQGQSGNTQTFAAARRFFRTAVDEEGFADVPFVVSEYDTRFYLGPEVSLVGSNAGAAQNVAKLIESVGQGDIEVTYLYAGRDGAFEPENPYSFPLSCTADFDTVPESGCECDFMTRCSPGCSPRDLRFSGVWSDCSFDDLASVADLPACLAGRCQFGPSPWSGMGAVLDNGILKPVGAALSLWAHAAGSLHLSLAEPAKARLEDTRVYAIAWQAPSDSRFASVLLVNPFDVESGSLPTPGELLGGPARVVGASRVAQYPLGESPASQVSGADGVNSTQTLVGEVVNACGDYERNPGVIPPLEPYETRLLSLEHGGGCICPNS